MCYNFSIRIYDVFDMLKKGFHMSNPIQEKIVHGEKLFPFAAYEFTPAFPPELFTAHWHSDYEIIYMQKGAVTFGINGISYPLSAHQALMVNPYQIHYSVSANTSDFSFTSIVFGNSLVFPSTESRIYTRYIHPSAREYIRFFPVLTQETASGMDSLKSIEKICLLDKSRPLCYEMEIQILLLSVFCNLLRANAYDMEIREDFHTLSYVQELLYLLRKNFAEDIKLEALAQNMNISYEHLCRSFKKVVGKSPKKFLNDLRFQHAVYLMKTSEHQAIAEIAESCGFSDMSYFAKCFRQKTGKTPSEYRNHMAGE